MGYSAYLNRDYIGPAGTTQGWGDFGRAVEALPAAGHEQVVHLWEQGYCKGLDALDAQLGKMKDPVAKDLLAALRAHRTPQHTLFHVSDGIGREDVAPGPDDAPVADSPLAPEDDAEDADGEFAWHDQPRVPAGHGDGGRWGSPGAKSVIKGGKHVWKFPKGHPKHVAVPRKPKAAPPAPKNAGGGPLQIGAHMGELKGLPGNWSPSQELRWQHQQLSESQQEKMGIYSGSAYEEINAGLRNPPPSKDAAAVARVVSKAIDAHGEFEEPITTYRGLSFKSPEEQQQFLATLSQGGEFQNKGFYSTSVDPKQALAFKNKHGVMFEIKAKKGVYMNGMSGFPGEREVLMNHHSRFKVTGAKRATVRHRLGKDEVIVIQVEQLH